MDRIAAARSGLALCLLLGSHALATAGSEDPCAGSLQAQLETIRREEARLVRRYNAASEAVDLLERIQAEYVQDLSFLGVRADSDGMRTWARWMEAVSGAAKTTNKVLSLSAGPGAVALDKGYMTAASLAGCLARRGSADLTTIRHCASGEVMSKGRDALIDDAGKQFGRDLSWVKVASTALDSLRKAKETDDAWRMLRTETTRIDANLHRSMQQAVTWRGQALRDLEVITNAKSWLEAQLKNCNQQKLLDAMADGSQVLGELGAADRDAEAEKRELLNANSARQFQAYQAQMQAQMQVQILQQADKQTRPGGRAPTIAPAGQALVAQPSAKPASDANQCNMAALATYDACRSQCNVNNVDENGPPPCACGERPSGCIGSVR